MAGYFAVAPYYLVRKYSEIFPTNRTSHRVDRTPAHPSLFNRKVRLKLFAQNVMPCLPKMCSTCLFLTKNE